MSPRDLATSILSMLDSTKTDDSIQNDLFELLGLGDFDMIALILQHRKQILATKAAMDAPAPRQAAAPPMAPFQTIYGDMPRKTLRPKQQVAHGPQVTVNLNTHDRQFRKKQRKDAKRRQQQQQSSSVDAAPPDAAVGGDYYVIDGQKVFVTDDVGRAQGSPDAFATPPPPGKVTAAQVLPHVYESHTAQPMTRLGKGLSLPEGTVHRDTLDLEEFSIPVSKVAPKRPGERLIGIHEFDLIGQKVFKVRPFDIDAD